VKKLAHASFVPATTGRVPDKPERCDEAAVVHWTQDSPELPTWPEACQRLKKEGRRSKVNHPSAAHSAYEFPAPLAR
jgi:hypothetical protein